MTKMKTKALCALCVLVAVAGAAIGSAYARSGSTKKLEKGTLRATVYSDGTLGPHSKDVTSVNKVGTGLYQITLKGSVVSCAPVASEFYGVGLHAGAAQTVAFGNMVNVVTLRDTGALQDNQFYLVVAC